MLITFQDRIRLPWLNGSGGTTKFISLDALLPIFIIPLILAIAALNCYCCIIIYLLLPIFLIYSYNSLRKNNPRTKFFLLWAVCSKLYLWILFEVTVPLVELLPQENVLFIILYTVSIYCFYKTKQRAHLNYLPPSVSSEHNDLLDDITEVEQSGAHDQNQHHQLTTILIDNDNDSSDNNDINQTTNHCVKCRKYVPPRTYHCWICQECVRKRDHHNIWLDCCIGLANQRYFFFGSYFSFGALLLGTNLSLTSICHPFQFISFYGAYILLPDDCSDVFDQYDVALCFVASIYGLLILIVMAFMIFKQCYYVFYGLTATEYNLGKKTKCGFLHNFKEFFFANFDPSK